MRHESIGVKRGTLDNVNPSSFGHLLLLVRKQLNASQQAISDLTLIPQSTVSRWESGRRFPSDGELAKLTAALSALAEAREDADRIDLTLAELRRAWDRGSPGDRLCSLLFARSAAETAEPRILLTTHRIPAETVTLDEDDRPLDKMSLSTSGSIEVISRDDLNLAERMITHLREAAGVHSQTDSLTRYATAPNTVAIGWLSNDLYVGPLGDDRSWHRNRRQRITRLDDLTQRPDATKGTGGTNEVQLELESWWDGGTEPVDDDLVLFQRVVGLDGHNTVRTTIGGLHSSHTRRAAALFPDGIGLLENALELAADDAGNATFVLRLRRTHEQIHLDHSTVYWLKRGDSRSSSATVSGHT